MAKPLTPAQKPLQGIGCHVLGCYQPWAMSAFREKQGRVRCCADHSPVRHPQYFVPLGALIPGFDAMAAARAALAELAAAAGPGPTPDSDRPNEGPMAPLQPVPMPRPPVGGGLQIRF